VKNVELLVIDINGHFTFLERFDLIGLDVNPVIKYCFSGDHAKSEGEIKDEIEKILFEKYLKCDKSFDTNFMYNQMTGNVEKAKVEFIYDSRRFR
jgi:hypothetical protein